MCARERVCVCACEIWLFYSCSTYSGVVLRVAALSLDHDIELVRRREWVTRALEVLRHELQRAPVQELECCEHLGEV